MNYMQIDKCSMSDGVGIRVVLWCSGCSLNCYNCQNPQTHDFNSGIPFTEETMVELLEALDKPYIDGLTLSGGHPLEAEDIPQVYEIVKSVKQKFLDKTIWLYTGFTYEQILDEYALLKSLGKNDICAFDVAKMCDVLVDGKYIDSLRDIALPFRGSSNQRLIDVHATLNSDTPDIPILYNI